MFSTWLRHRKCAATARSTPLLRRFDKPCSRSASARGDASTHAFVFLLWRRWCGFATSRLRRLSTPLTSPGYLALHFLSILGFRARQRAHRPRHLFIANLRQALLYDIYDDGVQQQLRQLQSAASTRCYRLLLG